MFTVTAPTHILPRIKCHGHLPQLLSLVLFFVKHSKQLEVAVYIIVDCFVPLSTLFRTPFNSCRVYSFKLGTPDAPYCLAAFCTLDFHLHCTKIFDINIFLRGLCCVRQQNTYIIHMHLCRLPIPRFIVLATVSKGRY